MFRAYGDGIHILAPKCVARSNFQDLRIKTRRIHVASLFQPKVLNYIKNWGWIWWHSDKF